MRDLFPPDSQNAYSKTGYVAPVRRIVEVYPYCDEEGLVLFEKVRYDPKDFSQRRPDGNGGWVNNLQGVRRVPFMLPELLAKPTWPVLLVEGEKDVLTAMDLGLLATTITEGAGNWDDQYLPFFRGRRVAVIPDEDRAGLAHAQRVAGALVMGGAASVRVTRLPGLGEGGDLSDFVAAGHNSADVIAAIRSAHEWKPN